MLFTLALAHMGIIGLAAVTLVFAAIYDSLRYRIPNRASFSLLVLFLLYALTAPPGFDWGQHLVVFALVLIFGFIMFSQNIAGAGDIKLLAVTGLWAGPHLLATFLCVTAVSAGLLGLVMYGLTYRRNLHRQNHEIVALTRVPLPHGVAIAFGGCSILLIMIKPLLFVG